MLPVIMMKLKALGLTVVMLIAAVAAGTPPQPQPSPNPPPAEFRLYGLDKGCACIRTHKETSSLVASEKTVGKRVVQEFSPRENPGVSLFRAEVGEVADSGVVKLWNYGIADEADFNGDGKTDYSWYGGDDTSSVMYLFLSSAQGYQRVNVIKTLKEAWTRRFHRGAPDLAAAGGKYGISDVRVRRTSSGLTLLAQINTTARDGKTEIGFAFEVEQAKFKQ